MSNLPSADEYVNDLNNMIESDPIYLVFEKYVRKQIKLYKLHHHNHFYVDIPEIFTSNTKRFFIKKMMNLGYAVKIIGDDLVTVDIIYIKNYCNYKKFIILPATSDTNKICLEQTNFIELNQTDLPKSPITFGDIISTIKPDKIIRSAKDYKKALKYLQTEIKNFRVDDQGNYINVIYLDFKKYFFCLPKFEFS